MVSQFVVPALKRVILVVAWPLVMVADSPVVRGHDPATEMAEAAGRFIASLDDQQQKNALFEFSSDKRDFWHFVPDKFIKPDGVRYGLKIGDMTPQQRLLAHALLSTGLSHKGYRQAVTIMTLEAILHDLEDQNPIRDPERHYTLCGDSSTVTLARTCYGDTTKRRRVIMAIDTARCVIEREVA